METDATYTGAVGSHSQRPGSAKLSGETSKVKVSDKGGEEPRESEESEATEERIATDGGMVLCSRAPQPWQGGGLPPLQLPVYQSLSSESGN